MLKISVIDMDTNEVLADETTEFRKFANVTVKYLFEDGTAMSNTVTSKVPAVIGETFNWTAPEMVNGYKRSEKEPVSGTVQLPGGCKQYGCCYCGKESGAADPYLWHYACAFR